jgi:signal peptidase I
MGAPEGKKPRIPFWVPITMGVLGGGALVGLVVARLFFFVPFKQPSGSMYPTLIAGEHLLVSAIDKTPKRGSVLVFRYPEHREQHLCKRVIGLAGEVVEVKSGRVYVNGWEVPRCFVGKHAYDDVEGQHHEGELFLEHLGDATYLVFEEKGALFSDVQGPYRAAPDEYFVLGDNRNNSHDSRMWFGGQGGGVPNGDTIGRVRAHDEPKLPPGAESLRPALDACLAKRPAETNPPASK